MPKYQEIAVQNDKSIENLLDTIFETSNLAGSKPTRSCVYIRFNVPPTRMTELVGNVNGTTTFVCAFAFTRWPDKIGIYSVSNTAKKCSIYCFVF